MKEICLTVMEEEAGARLDVFLHRRLSDYSRSRLQSWIRQGAVLVDGSQSRPSYLLRAGEQVFVRPQPLPALRAEPEPIPLRILYEDDQIVAVDKSAGMVVHAGAGRHSGTLVNALLHRFGRLSTEGGELRPGIVHRLDRDTSGVLLVARTDSAHRSLARQFAARQVEKLYLALVHGRVPQEAGEIRAPIARDPERRTRFTARLGVGRNAVTRFRVLGRSAAFTYLEIQISTGRTHQIRVHLSHLRHPLAGDTLYGAPRRTPGLPLLGRIFLHAWRIGFCHPKSGKWMVIEAPLPDELRAFLKTAGIIEKEGAERGGS